MPVIAMTRELGSKGKEIAQGLGERMGIPIVDHNLVEPDTTEKIHIDESRVQRIKERKTSLLERWQFQGKGLSNMTPSEIYELAEKDDVIIRGWGSTQLLNSIDHVLCVRVCAPVKSRVTTLMTRLKILDKTFAHHEIIINDTAHGQLMRRMTHDDWEDAKHYDLIINTGRVDVEESIDLIENTMQLSVFKKTAQSQAQLRKLRSESELRIADQTDAQLKTEALPIRFNINPHQQMA